MILARADRWFDRYRRTGDPRALAKVFDATAPELWRVAAHVCRDRHAAEDAVQGTLLSAIEARQHWDSTRPLLPWLLGMLLNRVREHRRWQARELDGARVTTTLERDPAELAEHAEFGAAFASALRRVAEPYRTTVERHLVNGCSAPEIALELGVPAGTVRMRLHRGLEQLRRKLPQGFVAGSAIALLMPQASCAAMRRVVLDAVPGGKAVVASSGQVVVTAIGALLMKKTTMVAVAVLALGLSWWALLPANSEPDAAAPQGSAMVAANARASALPEATRGDQTSAPDRRDATPAPVAAPGMGQLRVLLRNAGNGKAIAAVELEVMAGMPRDPNTPDTPNTPIATPREISVSASQVRHGRTDEAGVATFEVETGFASLQPSAVLQTRALGAVITAGQVTELVVDVPVYLHADLLVVDADGRAVAGAVILGRTSLDAGTLVERELGRTGPDGHWREGLVETAATVRAMAPGHAASAGMELRKEAAAVTLRLGEAPATLFGTVRGPDGATVAFAGVAIQPQTAAARTAPPLLVRADANGSYACDYVPPGPCLVFAWRDVGKGQRSFAKTAVTAEASARTVADVRFGRGARILAKLRRDTGDGLANQNVVAVPQSADVPWSFVTEAVGRCLTDMQGNGSIEGLMPGSYELQVVTGAEFWRQRIELAEGQDYEFTRVFGTSAWVGVQVLDPMRVPLQGWAVWLHPAEGTEQRAKTGADGRVRFESLAEGSYEVEVRKTDRHLPSLTRAAATNTDTELVLPHAVMPAASLHGVLVPLPGTVLADLLVRLFQGGSRSYPQAATVDGSIDVASGRFAFDELPAGHYGLMVMAKKDRAMFAVRTGIEVAAGSDVDLGAIDAGKATITCEVTCSGRAVRDAFAAVGAPEEMRGVFAARGRLAAAFGRPPQQVNGSTVELTGMPAATYPLLIWGADIAPVLTTVTAVAGQRTLLPIATTPASATTFRFVATGTRNFGAVTVLRDGVLLLTETINSAEAYVRGLSPGSYRIEFEGFDGPRGAADFTVGATPGPTIEVQVAR